MCYYNCRIDELIVELNGLVEPEHVKIPEPFGKELLALLIKDHVSSHSFFSSLCQARRSLPYLIKITCSPGFVRRRKLQGSFGSNEVHLGKPNHLNVYCRG